MMMTVVSRSSEAVATRRHPGQSGQTVAIPSGLRPEPPTGRPTAVDAVTQAITPSAKFAVVHRAFPNGIGSVHFRRFQTPPEGCKSPEGQSIEEAIPVLATATMNTGVTMPMTVTTTVTATTDAQPSALCRCGRALPPPRVVEGIRLGRPRLTCSLLCRRTRDRLLRQIRRREQWLAAWHDEDGAGIYTPAEVQNGIADVTADLDELAGKLGTPVPAMLAKGIA